MRVRLTIRPALLLAFSFGAVPATAADEWSDVRPLVTKYCADCHGPAERSAEIDFTRFRDDREAARARQLWRNALSQLDAGLMPPPEADQPSEAERGRLTDWMRHSVESIDPADPANTDPGPLRMRRLTLAEYDNSVRDLFGFEFRGANLGMTHEAGDGNPFGNFAAALDVSPADMDKYFTAADKVLDRFFGTELSSGVDGEIQESACRSRERWFGLESGKWRDPKTVIEPPAGTTPRNAGRAIVAAFARRAWRRPVTAAETDRLMRLYDAADSQGAGYPGSVRLALKGILVSPHFLFRIEAPVPGVAPDAVVPVGDVELATRLSYFLWSSLPDERLLDLAERGKLTRPGPSDEPVKLRGTVIGGPGSESHRGNDRTKVFDGDDTTFLDGPGRDSHWVGLDLGDSRPVTRLRLAPRPAHEARLVGGKVQGADTPDFAGEVTDLWTVAERPGRGYLALDLPRPRAFRYVRYVPPPNSFGNVAELEVWGPEPGTVLEQEVRRMLADPKARALTDNFAARWLGIDRLANARPSTEFFPEFNGEVRTALYDETTAFFDHLRTGNRSLLDLLDADYTFANDQLASFYKLDGVNGKELRRVPLRPEHHRGGLLGMGSVLAVTSHTSRTSPTLRGQWILKTVFGTPPPPPPANVSMISEKDEAGQEPTSFREKLAQHARDASCAACHKRMDPLGFALDNYNAVGQWRTEAGGKPLDVTGVLPTGERIDGAAELKAVVLAKKDQFLRHLTEQTLAYALGRELDFYDDGPAREITTALDRDNQRFETLILGIVHSHPFRHRRNAPEAGAGAE